MAQKEVKLWHKLIGWAFIIIGVLLIISPYYGCIGTENDFQCVIVSLMFLGPQITIGWLFLISGIIILAIKPELKKKTIIITSIILVLAILFFWISPKVSYNVGRTSCPGSDKVETVMTEGMQILADFNGQILNISAGPCYERTYTWEGGTCTILQQARTSRWYGSLGIYSPSSMDWKSGSCKELNHAVVEEGQQHFTDLPSAIGYINKLVKSNYSQTIYTSDGLVISWRLAPLEDKQFLNVDVWQVYVNGAKPANLEGAQDSKIKIITT